MMRRALEERDFPLSDLLLLASHRSSGDTLRFKGTPHRIQKIGPGSFEGVDLALFATEAQISREYVKTAVSSGAVAIDNSSAFRMDVDVPLVVPEVNSEKLRGHKGIIANPNCSTIQLVVVLWPIHAQFGIRRVVVSTYQSVSGKGRQALEELARQMDQYEFETGDSPYSMGADAEPEVFMYPIISNLIPQIDDFNENGYTKEEEKMMNETRKIMNVPGLKMTTTCVRIPVLFSHGESVCLETDKHVDPDGVRSFLSSSPGVRVVDDPGQHRYPLPAEAAGTDLVYVGRIRRDLSVQNGLNLWIVADNLRKGAATNAVQIAEKLLDLNLL